MTEPLLSEEAREVARILRAGTNLTQDFRDRAAALIERAEKDAARYRKVRQVSDWSSAMREATTPEEFDNAVDRVEQSSRTKAAIDAALSQERLEEKP